MTTKNYGSIVRNNLMRKSGYTPYCGLQGPCRFNWPRTEFIGDQFKCPCGWTSQYDPEFINEYKAKWKK